MNTTSRHWLKNFCRAENLPQRLLEMVLMQEFFLLLKSCIMISLKTLFPFTLMKLSGYLIQKRIRLRCLAARQKLINLLRKKLKIQFYEHLISFAAETGAASI